MSARMTLRRLEYAAGESRREEREANCMGGGSVVDGNPLMNLDIAGLSPCQGYIALRCPSQTPLLPLSADSQSGASSTFAILVAEDALHVWLDPLPIRCP